MAEFTKHEPGTFSWAELGTTDQAGAKAFYSELFGWSFNDSEMEPGNFYTMFLLRGKPVGACFKLGAQQAGMPPHWGTYVSVASADESAKKAAELGGKVIMSPFDVMTYGRMSVIQDPTGAVFSIWEPRQHIGAGIANETGSLVWNELVTRDTDAATKFYSALFGWTANVQQMGPTTYTTFLKGDVRVGGMPKLSEDMSQIPPHWGIYFGTDDCDATVRRATGMGGKVTMPATDIPGVGRFAMFQDPQGAHFAVIKFTMPG